MAEVFELRPHFEWRGLGFISQSGAEALRRLRRPRRRAALRGARACASPTRRRASAARCSRASSSRGSARCSAPPARPSAPIGTCMVSPRGRLRRLLQLRALRAGAGGGRDGRAPSPTASSGSSGSSRPRAPSAPKFRDERITMAHGAGGKATQTLIEGLLVPALRLARRSSELGDAGARRGRRRRAGDDHRQLRRQADPLPRRLDRRAGRQRHRQRPRGGRRAAAGADAVADPRGGPRRPTSCAPRSRRSRAAARGGGRARSSPATRRSSSAATPTAMYICTTGLGRRRPARARCRPAALRPGDRDPRLGPIGEHGTAIMLARGEFELDADDRVRHALAVAGGRRAARRRRAGAALHARRDARRRRLGAQRARARLRRGDGRARGRRAGRARRSPAPPRCSASTRCTSPTRASSSRSSRPRRADAALAALRAVPGCEQRGRDRRGARPSRPGWCWWRPRFGGRRVMDQLVGDPLPRIC